MWPACGSRLRIFSNLDIATSSTSPARKCYRPDRFAAAVSWRQCTEAGFAPADNDIEEAEAFTREAGRAAALRLLARQPEATAIVAANDLLALGIYEALRETGRRCPEDLSVIGHNDMPLVDLVDPPLSTIRISHREMGEQTGQLLLDLIEGVRGDARYVVTAPLLIVRRSTQPPEDLAISQRWI